MLKRRLCHLNISLSLPNVSNAICFVNNCCYSCKVMQFKDLRYVIKSVWSFTLCFAVFRWCWTAQPFPVCFTSSAVLKSPFAKRHAGPSQTLQQETEHKYRYHTLSSFLSLPEENLCGSTLVFAKLSVKFVFWNFLFFLDTNYNY